MENVRFVGLDVHVDSIAVAVAEPDRTAPELLGTFPHDVPKLVKRLRRLGNVRCCYEAGSCGFRLQRDLAAAGIECTVVAPSLVPVRSSEHIKTDRRDAVKLARFFRSGDLTPIHVPDEATEAIRDLERARDAAKRAERTARHQLDKFLLRHGRRFPGKTRWVKEHRRWILAQQFENPAHRLVLSEYYAAVQDQESRVERLTASLIELAQAWKLAPQVKALQALRGIRALSAITIVAEIADFSRFASAGDFMSYLGLVPSEHSSGDSRRRGHITRAGNGFVRRVLVEAAWAYQFTAKRSEAIRRRSIGASAEVNRIAWKAQVRLCSRLRKLVARGKEKNKAAVAIARELAGFIWAILREPVLLAG